MIFNSRKEAGARLAARLTHLRADDPVVVAIPRGGVPVAAPIAAALGAPLDVLLVHRVQSPSQPGLLVGTVDETGHFALDQATCQMVDLSLAGVNHLMRREREQLDTRERRIRACVPRVDLVGRNVVLVDDGIATGATVRAALRSLERSGVRTVVVAVPVAAAQRVAEIRLLADDVVHLASPAAVDSVAHCYADRLEVDDDEMMQILTGPHGSPAAQDLRPHAPAPQRLRPTTRA